MKKFKTIFIHQFAKLSYSFIFKVLNHKIANNGFSVFKTMMLHRLIEDLKKQIFKN